MTEEDIIRFVSGLPGVDMMTASEGDGAPEAAWGDTFFFYDPTGDEPADRRFPFATIVVSNYEGFDESSDLNRPGVFRLNIAVGRRRFEDLLGYRPSAHPEHAASHDYAALESLIPHPVYASQSWVSILNPGEASADRVRNLLTQAHARAAARHRSPR